MTFLHLLFFRCSLAQNSPYTIVAYFGVMYSASFHQLLPYSNVKCNLDCFNAVPIEGMLEGYLFSENLLGNWQRGSNSGSKLCCWGRIRVTLSKR